MAAVLMARSTAEATGLSRRQIRAVVGGFGIAGVVMVALLSAGTTAALTSGAPVPMLLAIHRTSLAGAAIMAGLVVTTLAVMSPPQDALRNLLELLPVSRRAASIGARLPVAAIAVGVSLTLSLTGYAASVRLLPSWAHALRSGTTQVTLVCTVVLGVGGAVIAMRSLIRRLLRLPAYHASTVAGGLAIALVLLAWGGHLLPQQQRFDVATDFAWAQAIDIPATAAYVAVGAGGPVPVAVLLTWSAAAFGLFIGTAAWDSRVHPPAFLPIGRGVPWPGGRTVGYVWAEMIWVLRTPQTVLACVSAPLLLVGLAWLRSSPLPPDLLTSLAIAPPLMLALLAAYAVGRTQPHHWISTSASARRGSWVWPKAAAAFACAALFAAPVAGIEVLLGLLAGPDLPELAWRVATVTSAALLAGTLTPYVEEVALTAAVATLTATVIALAGGLVLNQLQDTAVAGVARAALATVFLTSYGVAAHRLRPELGRRT